MKRDGIMIPNIPKGWFMLYCITTQAANRIEVTLKDDAKTYVDKKAQAALGPFPELAEELCQLMGTNLQLSIDIPQCEKFHYIEHSYEMRAPSGAIVAYGYSLVLEDGTDDDYNDLYVSIMAWKSKG